VGINDEGTIPSGHLFQSSFIYKIDNCWRSILFKFAIAEPMLHRIGITKNFLLVGQILFTLKQKQWIVTSRR